MRVLEVLPYQFDGANIKIINIFSDRSLNIDVYTTLGGQYLE